MTDYISREAIFDEIKNAEFSVESDGAENKIANLAIACFRDVVLARVRNFPAADVRPVVHGKWISHGKGWWRLRNGNIATDWHSFLLSAETFKKVCDIEGTFSKAETEWKPDYECSVCGSRAWQDEYNFCPNCGADMREES